MWISSAYAQGAGAPPGGEMMNLVLMVAIFGAFFFLMIRPQMKRAKEHKAIIDGLQKGDEVVAAGGLIGRVTKVGENYVTVEIANNVEIQIQRPAVQLVLPKGTIKNI
jgi:preprotein translocase subunit YajC